MENTPANDGKRIYEGMFILKASAASKDWNRASDELVKFLESHDAEIVSLDKWDERKLTYEIKKQNKGVYVLTYLRMAPERIDLMKREVELSNLILRLLLLASAGPPPAEEEEPAEKPAAEAEKPAAEGDKPAAEGDKPAAEGEKPAAEGEKPAAEGEKPAAEGEKPAAEGDKPAAEGDKPATGDGKEEVKTAQSDEA